MTATLPFSRKSSRTQLGQQCRDRVAGELRGVEGRLRQAAKRLRDLLRREGLEFGRSLADEQFCQQRGARDRSDAAAGAESRLGDSPRLDAHGKLEYVTAHGILDGNGGSGSIEGTGVTGILEMVEDGCAVHAKSIAPGTRECNASPAK
jgi:hypothetical protein